LIQFGNASESFKAANPHIIFGGGGQETVRQAPPLSRHELKNERRLQAEVENAGKKAFA
jgi:hypothetical protein